MDKKDRQIIKLTRLNDDLENYFRNTIIPQLFIDAHLILRKFTPSAFKQFNLSPDDIGKPLHSIIENLRFPNIGKYIQDVIETNTILEKEIQTSDSRWYQMNILPYIQQKNNQANGVILTFVEITSRIKDARDREKLIADYEILLDIISHDIKNPLTGLLLTINLLNNGTEEPEERKHMLQVVENGAKKIQEVISELTLARKNNHKYKATDEVLDIEKIIEDVRITLLEPIKDYEAVILKDLEVKEIYFCRRKLRSIIYNLMNNALKFRALDRKPEIKIKTRLDNNQITLSILDNGIGIDKGKHEEIFSKYFRVNNGIEGTGIGLHLVKQLVENSGGKIAIESEVDKGSEFKIILNNYQP